MINSHQVAVGNPILVWY